MGKQANIKKVINISVLVFTILIVQFAIPFATSAVEYGGIGGKPAYPDPNNPRSKSVFIYTLEPGDKKEDGVLVVNNSTEEKTLVVYSTDSQKSTDGSFACEQFSDSKEGVGAWIDLQKSEITLAPSTNEIIPFTIEAPETVSVGEENGCILIQVKSVNSAESGLSLSFRTGLRVAVTIPGEQKRELLISDFQVINESDLIKSRVSVINNGNVSIDANINVYANGIFNIPYQTISNTYPVLRGDTSLYNFEISKPYWGGILSISSSVDYDNSQEAGVGLDPESPNIFKTSESYTLIIPPQPLALIVEILAIIAIISLTILIYRRYRKQSEFNKLWDGEYIVKEGDDIESIAKTLKLNWKDIAKYNKLTPPYSLKKGKKIKVIKRKA